MSADRAPIAIERVAAGPWDQSCYVVSTGAGDAVVIDPGDHADRIVARATSGGARVRAVVATHGHHDHVGAAAEVAERCGAPFALHRADRHALRRLNFCRRVLNDLPPVDAPAVAIDLAEVGELRLGTLTVAVVHTPGHSPGSVCLAIRGELFTGDTLLATGLGTTDMPGSDPDALRASVGGLVAAYPPDTAIHPGHGEPVGTLGDAVAGLGARWESTA